MRTSGGGYEFHQRLLIKFTDIVLPRTTIALTDAPAWICNGRYDVLAMNQLARALYSPVLVDTRRPANTARFVYLDPEAARRFFVDYDRIACDVAAKLRMEVGRSPHLPRGACLK